MCTQNIQEYDVTILKTFKQNLQYDVTIPKTFNCPYFPFLSHYNATFPWILSLFCIVIGYPVISTHNRAGRWRQVMNINYIPTAPHPASIP